MPTQPLLTDFVLVLGAALVVLLVSRPLRLPPTLGFMLTGMLIGPHGLRGVSDTHQVDALADVGVTLLLFVIGLEFSIARLREYRRAFLLGGTLQVLLTLGAVYALASPLLAPPQALTMGCMVALSSTAMVFRLLSESQQTSSPAGRVMTGILLFQDFAMVPMIAIVPALAGRRETLAAGPSFVLGLLAAAIAFAAARYVMPRALALVARSGVRELFVIGAVFICLGSAAATASLGLSAALGAFLAGILVGESEYSHRVVSEILPFRDLFNSLFFVAIGMLLDLRFVAASLALVLGLSAGVIVLKAFTSGITVLFLGYPTRVAVIVALGLAQIGEFTFVIARLAQSSGLLTVPQYQAFLAAAVLTLGATPFLMRLAPEAGARLAALVPSGREWPAQRQGPGVTGRAMAAKAPAHDVPARDETKEATVTVGSAAAMKGAASVEESVDKGIVVEKAVTGSPREPRDHVLIIGYGLNGRNLARVLRAVGIPYLAVDLDAKIVGRARREGEENILYGDATRRETLLRCGIEHAAVVVFVIADPDADRRGVKIARSLNPAATVIVRTRLISRVDELRRLGADEVIPEEFETSIAIFARVLRRLRVPSNVIRNQELLLRSESYEFLRESESRSAIALARASALLAAGTTDSFLVQEDSPAAGRELRETELRSRTGTMIVAVVRDGRPTVGPPPDFRIEKGDVLVLVGDHTALERAFEVLGGSPSGSAG